MPMGRKERPTMTKPREKTREDLTAEIEDGKKKIRQFENREKVLRRKLSIVNNSTHFDISKSTLALCCVLSAAQGFFRFWRFWATHSMPCTQDAPLYFVESDDNQPNRKRSRETAYQRHGTANRGTVQSIRADGRYFTNPSSIDFSRLILSPFSPKITANSACSQSVYSFIWKTVLTIFIGLRLFSFFKRWLCKTYFWI